MRHDDLEEKAYFRSSERLFRVNGDWYFSAREGDQGPFETEKQAGIELERYIEEQISLHKFIKSGVKVMVLDKHQGTPARVDRGESQSADTYSQLGMVI